MAAFVVPPNTVLKNVRQLSEHGDISGMEEVAQEIQELEAGMTDLTYCIFLQRHQDREAHQSMMQDTWATSTM